MKLVECLTISLTVKQSLHCLSFKTPTQDFNIGLIVGASGSGKSSLLKQFGEEETIVEWDSNKAVCSHFENTRRSSR